MVRASQKDNGDLRGRRFLVFGRALPTEQNPNPQVMVVRVYARNAAFARSAFWKSSRILKRVKRTRGEILKVQEVFEQGRVKAKNYGIFLKYRSTTGVHNCFKEYRAVSIKDAINQMYNEMGGNYKCSADRIEIIRTVQLETEQLKKRNQRCLQWINKNIEFPIWNRTSRRSNAKYNNNFSAQRPVALKTMTSVNA